MEFLLDPNIWAGFITLVVLEVVLGIDNLVFIAILADKLPLNNATKPVSSVYRWRSSCVWLCYR